MKQVDSQWVRVLVLSIAMMAVSLASLGAVPSLTGSWAMLQVYPRIADLPLVGSSAQVSYVVQRVDVEQDGLSLVMNDVYCFTFIDEESSIAATDIPAAFMQSLRPQPRTATLSETDEGFAFDQPTYIEVRGAILENAETDELPSAPEDPRVIDQDDDGFPGMTVNVSLLGLMADQIYVVQRVQYALQGTVISDDRIEGLIEWTDEQNVLDATSALLMAGTESQQDPDPTKHFFVMLRAEEEWTCEWLQENWRDVFGVEGGASD